MTIVFCWELRTSSFKFEKEFNGTVDFFQTFWMLNVIHIYIYIYIYIYIHIYIYIYMHIYSEDRISANVNNNNNGNIKKF